MDEFLVYMAGFFDGEGSIGVYTNGKRNGRTLRVQVTQTITESSSKLLDEAQSRWGGSLCTFNKRERRAAFIWQLTASGGYKFLKDVRPWLRLKAKEADLVLTWWPARAGAMRDPATGRRLPLSVEDREADSLIDAQLRILKKGT